MSSGSLATKPDDLILVGPASSWQSELRCLPQGGMALGVINEAGLEVKKFDYWFTCHSDRIPAWSKTKRRKFWQWVTDTEAGDLQFSLPWMPGSSSLFATLAALSMFAGKVYLVGCPMSDEEYQDYRIGWIYHAPILGGRVYSASGWTRGFLESLGNRWPF